MRENAHSVPLFARCARRSLRTLYRKHRKQAIYMACAFHAGAARSFFLQLCEYTRRLVNSESRRRGGQVPMDRRTSGPLLSQCPLCEIFCENERIVAPLLGHQSLSPLVFYSLSFLCSSRETNDRSGVAEEEGRETKDTAGAFEIRLC